jgi:hypothetical protein
MKSLKRYWFRFETFGKPTSLNLGCGVTAYDYEDAVNLLHDRVFARKDLPGIIECSENVDVSTLDQKHVLPNIGLVTVRGVWFPQGYEEMK